MLEERRDEKERDSRGHAHHRLQGSVARARAATDRQTTDGQSAVKAQAAAEAATSTARSPRRSPRQNPKDEMDKLLHKYEQAKEKLHELERMYPGS